MRSTFVFILFCIVTKVNAQYINYQLITNRVIDTTITNVPHRVINTIALKHDSIKKQTQLKILPVAISTLEKNKIGAELGIGFSVNHYYSSKLAASINYQRVWLNGTTGLDSSIQQTHSTGSVGTAYYTKNNSFSTSNYLDFNVRYTPNKYINLHTGRNRFFVGEGYRSLILSDNATPFYHFSFDAKFKQFQYATTYAHLVDINDSKPLDNKNRNKFMTFHSISYTPTKWLNVQLYETVVFPTRSNNPYKFKYDLTYLNPITFFRPVEYSQGSTDNELLGLNLKIKPIKNLTLYSQFVLDEFLLSYFVKRTHWWGNKYAAQAGAKYNYTHNKKQFVALTEFNYVRPYTYAHADSLINYGHYNQSLAHPAGANFVEALGLLSYRNSKLQLVAKCSYFVAGLSTANKNYGSNIYTSYTSRVADFGVATLQGNRIQRITANLQASYSFKLATVCVGTTVIKTNDVATIVYVGIQSTLFNHYNDY